MNDDKLAALKSALDSLFTAYPEGSTERQLIAMMLMNYAVLAGEKVLVAEPKWKKGKYS